MLGSPSVVVFIRSSDLIVYLRFHTSSSDSRRLLLHILKYLQVSLTRNVCGNHRPATKTITILYLMRRHNINLASTKT